MGKKNCGGLVDRYGVSIARWDFLNTPESIVVSIHTLVTKTYMQQYNMHMYMAGLFFV